MKNGTTCDSPLTGASRPEKALWYQEVLSLDPQSRIFLPYARFLADLDRRDEAIQALKSGLAMHPEFLEARLLLIQLLNDAGEDESAGREASGIIEALSHAPALWKLWSRRPEVRPDQAAMLLFLGSCLVKNNLGLADVLHAGLAALSAEDAAPQDTSGEKASGVPEPEKTSFKKKASLSPQDTPECKKEDTAAAGHAFVMTEDTPWYGLDSVPEDDEVFDEEPSADTETAAALPDLSPLLTALSGEMSAAEEHAAGPAPQPVPRASVSGKCSLHTRSMASVLEEQGVYAEAANIYRELLKNCTSEEERSEIRARLEALDVRSASSALPADEVSAMTAMLEELAVRLENRVCA